MKDPRLDHDIEVRTQAMQSDVLLVAIAAVSLMQGMPWSPLLFPVVTMLKLFFSGTILGSPMVLTYIGSIMVSALTVAIAGIPAALYERSKGLKASNATSLGIWLAATLALVVVPLALLR
ncbi:MAG: hypothetical protein KGP27_07440 [Hyphomicrobiales bacterium]|nr:hypothetical protein [Hyphomicrobiales bacterium]